MLLGTINTNIMTDDREALRAAKKKGKRMVKNRLMIGDSKLSHTVHPEMKGPGDRYSEVNKINRSNLGPQNVLAYETPTRLTRLQQVDGGNKKEIRAKSPRVAQVYGSRKRALKAFIAKVLSDGYPPPTPR